MENKQGNGRLFEKLSMAVAVLLVTYLLAFAMFNSPRLAEKEMRPYRQAVFFGPWVVLTLLYGHPLLGQFLGALGRGVSHFRWTFRWQLAAIEVLGTLVLSVILGSGTLAGTGACLFLFCGPLLLSLGLLPCLPEGA